MARSRASLAVSEPEFDEAWPEEPTPARVAPHLVPALEQEDPADNHAAIPRGTAVPGRRTVTIRGQVAARPAPRRPRRDPYDRVGTASSTGHASSNSGSLIAKEARARAI